MSSLADQITFHASGVRTPIFPSGVKRFYHFPNLGMVPETDTGDPLMDEFFFFFFFFFVFFFT